MSQHFALFIKYTLNKTVFLNCQPYNLTYLWNLCIKILALEDDRHILRALIFSCDTIVPIVV